MGAVDEAIRQLEERVARYRSERYPVQHATAQFHLGVALTNAARLAEAQNALGTAVRLFEAAGLATEHAKAVNALGAALRLAGRPADAARAFSHAAETFQLADLALEQGAARFNLGLVQREAGEPEEAVASFERAGELFDAGRAPAQAAAAAREVGATLLALGRLADAAGPLERALTLAESAGDQAGRGAAANALGLSRLVAGTVPEALEAFRTALACHPRSLRPQEYAMAKANVALALERAGDEPGARLAARQALGVPGAAEAVVAQADALLERLGAPRGDLLAVLAAQPRERWVAIVREELVRWVDAPDEERRAEAAAWIGEQLTRETSGTDLAEAWLGALLELPTDAMELVIRSALEAVAEAGPASGERFRTDVSAAMARFYVPQWMRLADTFNRIASELGQAAGWR